MQVRIRTRVIESIERCQESTFLENTELLKIPKRLSIPYNSYRGALNTQAERRTTHSHKIVAFCESPTSSTSRNR